MIFLSNSGLEGSLHFTRKYLMKLLGLTLEQGLVSQTEVWESLRLQISLLKWALFENKMEFWKVGFGKLQTEWSLRNWGLYGTFLRFIST